MDLIFIDNFTNWRSAFYLRKEKKIFDFSCCQAFVNRGQGPSVLAAV